MPFTFELIHEYKIKCVNFVNQVRLDSKIEYKSPNNTYLKNIETFIKLFKKLNIIESRIIYEGYSLDRIKMTKWIWPNHDNNEP